MHELTLMRSVVTIVSGAVGQSRVRVVRLSIGRDSCTSPHALRMCFGVCTRGTPLDGARLEILHSDGHELRVDEVEVD